MQLLSVNIGQERTLQTKNHTEQTGIFKIPTTEPVHISSDGLAGDVIYSKKHHGGPDQAVYVYGAADYAWWANELGKEILPGTFGENLTISEMESRQFNIGDYLRINAVTLQISAPRIPCGTFAARMEDPQFVKRFREAERPGLYCRVIHDGMVQAGDEVSIERYQVETISIVQIYRDYYDKNKSEETIRHLLELPIAVRFRKDLEEELQKIGSLGVAVILVHG